MEFKIYKPEPAKPSFGKLEADYVAPYQAWQADKSPTARQQMLQAMNPILDSALHSYAGGNVSPNLRSQARLMALKALDTYDPKRATLRTHMLSQLQSLRRTAASSSQIISVPERIRLDRAHLSETESALEDSLGRPPTTMELSRRLGLSPKRIAYIRTAAPPINSGRLTGEAGEPYDPAATGSGESPAAQMWQTLVYHDLTPQQQLIMERSLGLHGHKPHSTEQLAKMLGVSASAVSQQKAKIQKMLDARFQSNIMGES